MEEREIFLAACEIESLDAQNAFLDQACAGRSSLRQRLRALVELHRTTENFLEIPALDQAVIVANPTIVLDTVSIQRQPNHSDDSQTSTLTEKSDGDFEDRISLYFLRPPTKPDSIGRLGDYEVLEVLGRGAFGIVLKAFDEVLRRTVAIKVMSPNLAATTGARTRFLREARASAGVRHENVVQIYAVGELPIPYLVMEYIPGLTIQQQVEKYGPFEIAEAVRLGQQIALGLAAAHAAGLIHRDIKPSNILLESESESGRAKITDFGLACAADDASGTQSGLIAGTPMYMSPEQILGEVLDFRSDLLSLGGVLHFMVSGQTPFPPSSTVAILKRVSDEMPRPLSDVRPNAPDWLSQIVSKLYAKRPGDRFSSAKEVADLLGRHLSDSRADETRTNTKGLTQKVNGQSLYGRIALVAVVLAIAIGAAVANRFNQSSSSVLKSSGNAESSSTTESHDPAPINLGSRLRAECFDAGSMADVSFDAEKNVFVLNPERNARNLWIRFFELESSNLAIETRMRVENSDQSGFVKFVFKRYPDIEVFGMIASSPEGIKVWINDAVHPAGEQAGVPISQLNASKWFDLKYEVSSESYSVSIDGKVMLQVPREDPRSGYVAIGGAGWRVEMQDLRATLSKNSQVIH